MADHPDRPQFTYDVIAISHGGDQVPLTAGSNITSASEIARARSGDKNWAAMQVRESGTAEITATYIYGEQESICGVCGYEMDLHEPAEIAHCVNA
jgi:hypothetical protein